MNATRAEPPPEPPTRRARRHRGGVKRRSRAAPPSCPVSPVSKPSVPQNAPAVPVLQHAAGVPAGKLRDALRQIRVLKNAIAVQTSVRASEAALLRFCELTTATASDQETRLRHLTTVTFDLAEQIKATACDQDTRLLALANITSDQDTRLLALEPTTPFASALEQIKTSSSDLAARLRALEGEVLDGVYRELDELKRARDDIREGLGEAADRTSALRRDLRGLEEHVRLPRDHVRPRSLPPSLHDPARVAAAREKLDAQQLALDLAKEAMPWSGQSQSDHDIYRLRVELHEALLGLRQSLWDPENRMPPVS